MFASHALKGYMINKTAVYIFLCVSLIYSNQNKINRSIYFNKIRETPVADSCQKIIWHKKWTNLTLYPNPGCNYCSDTAKYSLIEETFEDNWDNFSHFSEQGKSISISAIKWDYNKNEYSNKIWQISDTGCKSSIRSPFYIVTKQRCCDIPNPINIYSIKTGKLIIQIFNEINYSEHYSKLNQNYCGHYFKHFVIDKNNVRIEKINILCYLISDTSTISTIEIPFDHSLYSGFNGIGLSDSLYTSYFQNKKKIDIEIIKNKLLYKSK